MALMGGVVRHNQAIKSIRRIKVQTEEGSDRRRFRQKKVQTEEGSDRGRFRQLKITKNNMT